MIISYLPQMQRWSSSDQNDSSYLPVTTSVFCWLGKVSGSTVQCLLLFSDSDTHQQDVASTSDYFVKSRATAPPVDIKKHTHTEWYEEASREAGAEFFPSLTVASCRYYTPITYENRRITLPYFSEIVFLSEWSGFAIFLR